MIGKDPYFNRPEVSNSDLSALAEYFDPPDFTMDLRKAYRDGNLIDAMITEAHRVDHYLMRVDDEQFTTEEWNNALRMRDAFMKDPQCANLLKLCKGQAVKALPDFQIEYAGISFQIAARCKYDLWSDPLNWGGDIKSTAATSQKQFEAACKHFRYDRQRAWYMDISGAKQDILLGISKVNHKIFRIPITRDSEFYRSGKAQYQELAFKWWLLFGDLQNQKAA